MDMFVTLTVEVASQVYACVPAREILYMKQVLLVFFLVNPFYLHEAVIILKADERDPEHPKGSTPWLSGRTELRWEVREGRVARGCWVAAGPSRWGSVDTQCAELSTPVLGCGLCCNAWAKGKETPTQGRI